jgi:hypothetical protein
VSYIDHYEIETKRPGCDWEHVGNVYPKYKWTIHRPRYFLGFVRVPVIANDAQHQAHVALAYVEGSLVRMRGTVKTEGMRVWVWRRGWFNGLTKTLLWELP